MSLVRGFGWGWGEGPEEANIKTLNLHESASDHRREDTNAENPLYSESGGRLPRLSPQPRLLTSERLLAGGPRRPQSPDFGKHWSAQPGTKGTAPRMAQSEVQLRKMEASGPPTHSVPKMSPSPAKMQKAVCPHVRLHYRWIWLLL